jgi:hypothetical protein
MMASDTGRQEAKRQDMVAIATEAVMAHARSVGTPLAPEEAARVASAIVDGFVTLTPPETDTSIRHVTVVGPGLPERGETVKPGNIRLDMRKLVTSAARGVVAIAGAAQIPWTIPLVALEIWDNLWSLLKVDLSEREAAVFWTMWLRADREDCVAGDQVLAYVNEELSRHGRDPITEQEVEDSLRALERMGCIERSRGNPTKWWLREWIRVTYR